MSKLLKLQKLKKGVMAMGICWMYLSDVPIDEEKKKSPTNCPYWDKLSTIEYVFEITSFF